MVNFILFHKGKLPSYIKECIEQIHFTQTNYNLYLLTDETNIDFKNTNIINIKDVICNDLNDIAFYVNNEDPLWRTSFERFFYIKEVIQNFKLKNIIHFDNDVLIYKNINDIIDSLSNNIQHIGLPTHKANEFVCGFMYIKDLESISQLCKYLLPLAQKGEIELEKIFKSWPHEMRLLGEIYNIDPNLITPLPILPSKNWNNLYKILQGVFDPSSYGQYFGETQQKAKNTIHPSDVNRYIDQHILNGNIKPVFKKESPYILYNEKQIPIFNLHIHCKSLIDFCSYTV
jgi:hypothetical protein